MFIAFVVLLLPPSSFAQEAPQRVENIEYVLVVGVMDYLNNFPRPNVNITMTIDNFVLNGLTDDFGCIRVSFNASKDLANNITMSKLSIYGNLTLIKIQDYMVESLYYDCFYSKNLAVYTGLNVRPRVISSKKETLLYYIIYVLDARAVNVSDLDPLTMGFSPVYEPIGKLALNIKSAIPIDVKSNIYESTYLFPINYPVNIKVTVYKYGNIHDEVSIETVVTENTTYVNVMGPILDFKLKDLLKPLESKISIFKSLGLPMIDEERQMIKINDEKNVILKLMENRMYEPALKQLKFLMNKIMSLKSGLSSLELSLKLSLIIVMIFIYIFSSLISILIVENGKSATRFILYFSLLLLFLMSHSEFRTATALFSTDILLTATQHVDNFTILFTGLTLGTLAFLTPTLISLYFPPLVTLSLELSIRDVKRHFLRTILTILALSLIVGSTLAVFRITYSHMISETVNQSGFNYTAVCLQSTTRNILVEDELTFLNSMGWINSSYLIKSLHNNVSVEEESGLILHGSTRIIIESVDSYTLISEALIADPGFLDKYFNFSSTVTRGGYLIKGERCILAPASLKSLRLGDRVKLRFMIAGSTGQFTVEATEFNLGDFIVKGFYDPELASRIILPDGSPLIDQPYKAIIVTDDYIPGSIHVERFEVVFPRRIVVSEKSQRINMLKVDYAFLVPDSSKHIDVYEDAREILELTGYRIFAVSNGLCKTYEELYVLDVVGVPSIAPPVVIVTLMIVLTINSIMYERRREIWTLAVVGGSPRAITNMFLMEAIILGILSTAIGYLCYSGIYMLSEPFLQLLKSWKPELAQSFAELSSTSGFELPSIFVILIIGLAVPIVGSYIVCVKAQGLTLLGRSPRRNVGRDVERRGVLAEYTLPIRASSLDGETLYNYLKDHFLMKDFRVMKLSGVAYQDGIFNFKFTLHSRNIITECTLKGVRRNDAVYPVLTFPSECSEAMDLHKFLYDLENVSLSYPTWRRRMKMEIVRVKPVEKARTIDDVLHDAKIIREQLYTVKSKLETVEKLKATTSSTLLTEYEKKYVAQVERLNRVMIRLGLELEPLYNQLNNEFQRLNMEIEKLNIAYKLGELSEEEYGSSAKPLKDKIEDIRRKLNEAELLINQLKKPRIQLTARRTVKRKKEEYTAPAYCPYCGSTKLTKQPDGSVACGRCRRKLR